MEKNNTNCSVKIYGKNIDDETRCVHYNTKRDIIAIKFKCCNKYYPCYSCHNESEKHQPKTWESHEYNNLAIFCGSCKSQLSINNYLTNSNKCPNCRADFNPNCALHHKLYFA
jgi:uncharacterized CHY-type Zn-finger protein